MLSIQFPEPDFNIRTIDGKEHIFDNVRKRWVRLTNEEWVRQNFIRYLTDVKNYPASLISVEKEITLHELKKRYDIAVYKKSVPWLLVECKEMNVPITENVLDQLLRYNYNITATYLVITNGNQSFGWKIEKGNFIEINVLPDWN
ncbi:MAG: type I restriction enzyme HsdR N-terminal domain-containing protein [Arachidicoccus sp.]|nr:type I restriction enzyme HsdR N-terminal domain-containing protein [Arachidicoccus sp.]